MAIADEDMCFAWREPCLDKRIFISASDEIESRGRPWRRAKFLVAQYIIVPYDSSHPPHSA
eukprot:scaffold7213_cov166-Amphora_coffeaeformis.AAC.6